MKERFGDVRGDALRQHGGDRRIGDQLPLRDPLTIEQARYRSERLPNDAFVQQDGSGAGCRVQRFPPAFLPLPSSDPTVPVRPPRTGRRTPRRSIRQRRALAAAAPSSGGTVLASPAWASPLALGSAADPAGGFCLLGPAPQPANRVG